MRQETDIYARLHRDETELLALNETITDLQHQVKDGASGWQDALRILAAHGERRRSLVCEVESLRWVLAAEAERATGGRQTA